MRPFVAFAILILTCPTAWAQVNVEMRQVLSGIEPIENIGGMMFVSEKSKPVVETVGFVDLGTIPEKAQSVKVIVTDAARKPLETKRISNSQWIIKGSGKVWIEARVIDLPSQFLLDESMVFELTAPAPTPAPNPIPGPTDLPKLSMDARKVMVDFVQSMAADIEAVNGDIDAAKVKTVAESAAATIQRDIATRNKFKSEMNKLLEPRLGNAALPANAKQTFSEIANGWRSVK